MKDKISETLNLEPIIEYDEIVTEDKQISTIEENLPAVNDNVGDNKEMKDDIKYVRGNLYDMIQNGTRSLDELMSLADQMQHPRAYEVIATLMKTMLEANRELVDLQAKRKELLQEEIKATAKTQTINNNLIMSTKDLITMLKKADSIDE